MIRKTLVLLALLIVSACASYDLSQPVSQSEIADLTRAIRNLGPDVDPREAARAARIALTYPRQLAVQYGITDPPLIHNTKVNAGRRPRGLCYQWADDMEARLRQENFQTLQLHRAIANATNILIEHSTVIISARGDDMFKGIVLDPWRHGGLLFWSPTLQDERYKWVPRQEVFEYKARRAKRQQG
jgi:hypothetical protein